MDIARQTLYSLMCSSLGSLDDTSQVSRGELNMFEIAARVDGLAILLNAF